MSSSIAVIVGAALAITVGAAICATWDRMCPYQSPLSHLLCWTMDRMKPVVAATLWVFIVLKVYLSELLWTRWRGNKRRVEEGESGSLSESSSQSDEARENPWSLAQDITSRAIAWVGRKEETDNDVIVATVKRVVLTSEQPAALIHAATNICAIDDKDSLRQFLSDADFFDRLHDLFSTSRESSQSLPTQLRTVHEAATKAFASAILHLALSVGTLMDLAPPEDRAVVIKNSLQVQPVLSYEIVLYFNRIASWVQLENDLWGGDLKDANHLLLLGVALERLFRDSRDNSSRWWLFNGIRRLADFTTSHQLLRTLSCAAKLYIECPQWDFLLPGIDKYEALPQLFEVAKTTYGSRQGAVPFLLEALKLYLGALDDDRSEFYQICLDIFRHACELDNVDLTGAFASVGRLMRNVELDIRNPVAQTRYGKQLRSYKHQYVEIILRNSQTHFYSWDVSEFGKSLAETLRYVREVAATQEPGHSENRATLNLFRSLRTLIQAHAEYYPEVQLFMEEYDTFEAWIDEGGCANSPGRLNRDPELYWCPYAGR